MMQTTRTALLASMVAVCLTGCIGLGGVLRDSLR